MIKFNVLTKLKSIPYLKQWQHGFLTQRSFHFDKINSKYQEIMTITMDPLNRLIGADKIHEINHFIQQKQSIIKEKKINIDHSLHQLTTIEHSLQDCKSEIDFLSRINRKTEEEMSRYANKLKEEYALQREEQQIKQLIDQTRKEIDHEQLDVDRLIHDRYQAEILVNERSRTLATYANIGSIVLSMFVAMNNYLKFSYFEHESNVKYDAIMQTMKQMQHEMQELRQLTVNQQVISTNTMQNTQETLSNNVKTESLPSSTKKITHEIGINTEESTYNNQHIHQDPNSSLIVIHHPSKEEEMFLDPYVHAMGLLGFFFFVAVVWRNAHQ